MITVKFKEDTPIALNYVDRTMHEKGKQYTAQTNTQKKVYESMVQQGKAEIVSPAPEPKPKGQKIQKPATESKTTRGPKPQGDK